MKLRSILALSAAVMAFGSSQAQTHVNTNGKKYTLVEEATGAWCGYCPDGAQIIEENIEPYGTSANYPNAIIASFHNSHHAPYVPDDDMELTGDPFCTGSMYITGFPMGTVDRAVFGGSVGQNRGSWPGDVSSRLSTSPMFDIYMLSTYDPATSKLTVKIMATTLVAGTGQWNVNGYLVEDSISSASGNYVQHSYMYTDNTSWFYNMCSTPCPSYACASCAILPSASYAHMNVVEKIFATGGIWGDKMFTNPNKGDTASKTYTYTVPAKFIGSNGGTGWTSDYKKMKVIGFVQKYGASTTDRAVENVIEANVKSMLPSVLGVSSVSAEMEEVKVYPNPAGNVVSVNYITGTPSATKIAIRNSVGQLMLEKSYPIGGSVFNENIELDNFANGMYFMTVESNGNTVTRQFSVVK